MKIKENQRKEQNMQTLFSSVQLFKRSVWLEREQHLELLEARNGTLEPLETRNGALELLDARNGSLESLDARNEALEPLEAPFLVSY